MATQTLKVKATAKGQGNYKGKITLQVSQHGTTKRAFILIEKVTTSLEHWNEERGCFTVASTSAIADNGRIKTALDALMSLQKEQGYTTPQELKTAYLQEKQSQKSGALTLGNQVAYCIKQEQTNASTNYQRYVELYNKLQGVNKRTKATFKAPTYNGVRLFDIPMSEIGNAHFCTFGDWIKSELGGKGYIGLMANFHTVFERYAEKHPEIMPLTYKWRKNKPKNGNTAPKVIYALKHNAIEQIEKLDLSTLMKNHNKHHLKLLELYRDTFLLMYYTLSRPADVIQFQWGKHYNPETETLTYYAYKNRHKGNAPKRTTIHICDPAKKIIEKYKGKSPDGYILPLPINSQSWDLSDVEQHRQWENKRKHTLQQINNYLKRIATVLQLDVPSLTNYIFRHSSITNSIYTYKTNANAVARMAATSLPYINNHYLADTDEIPFTFQKVAQ